MFVPSYALRCAKLKDSDDVKELLVLSKKDYRIAPSPVHNIEVDAPFNGLRKAIVDKILIGSDSSNLLASPATFVSAEHLFIPMANPRL